MPMPKWKRANEEKKKRREMHRLEMKGHQTIDFP